MNKSFQYIIVGQGIAGTVLAHELLSEGKSVLVIDEPNQNSSSRIAAGLYNPITGRKAVKTWMAESLFDALRVFYTKMEVLLQHKFLHDLPMYRPFKQVEDQNEWLGNSSDQGMKRFVSAIYTESIFNKYVKDTFGGMVLNETGYLDIPTLLELSKNYFRDKGAYLEERFEESLLQIEQDKVKYRDVEADMIIYCNGVSIQESMYFNWLPMRPVKGDVLYIQPKEKFDKIFNRGCFILPHHDGFYKAGSTYHHDDLSLLPTERGQNEMVGKIDGLLNTTYMIQNHLVGIRPATKDRKPFIGYHPTHKKLAVFNGLGAKGVSLAPFFAKHFVQSLLTDKEIMRDVSVERYYKYA